MKSSAEEQAGQLHSRAVVWIDHLTAKVFSMGLSGVTPSIVHAHLSSPHLHHKANAVGDGRIEEDSHFLEQVAKAVAGCREVLILGPGIEKAALQQYVEVAYPQIMLRLQSCDHPTDAEIVALGRKYFRID